MKNAFVLNTASRRGREFSHIWKEAFILAGIEVEEVHLIKHPAQLQATLEKLVGQSPEAIYLAGGDGTQQTGAQVLHGTNVALGVIPTGTGNSLARELEIPFDPVAAVQALKDADRKFIDLGELEFGKERKIFVTLVTIGLTGGIVDALTRKSREKLGVVAYLPSALQAYLNFKPIDFELIGSEFNSAGAAIQIVFAAGQLHAGPFSVTPDALLDDGFINGYVVRGSTRQEVIAYAMALGAGIQTALPYVEPFAVKEIRFESHDRTRVIIDGEKLLLRSFTVRCLPTSLCVLTPRKS